MMSAERNHHPMVKPIQTNKPVPTTDEVQNLLLQRYGIQASVLKEFNSYDDRTYYVKTKPGHGIGERSEFIAKVLNSRSTALGGSVVVQTSIMNHLKSFPELRCQAILPNLDGDLVSYEMISNELWDGNVLIGREKALSALRLFQFLPGKILEDVPNLPLSFFFDAGRHLGQLQQALQRYSGDTGPLKLRASKALWSLLTLPQLRQYLPLVTDDQKRLLVEEVMDQFETTVLPAISELRKGVVFNDFNENNVLVTTRSDNNDPDMESPSLTCDSNHTSRASGTAQHQISGIIDFDDLMYTCLVFEIAIGMVYMMFCSDQPIEAAAHLLAGFETISPLPDSERRLLKVLVASRFVQSLLIGLLQSKNHPDNAYVGSALVKGWTLLEGWWSRTKSQLQELWDCVRAQCLDACV